jgi:predicted enzyme related to lactoylglutathione lyase
MLRKIAFAALSAALFPLQAKAQSPVPDIGAFTINTSQDGKVLADWYSKFFGVEVKSLGGGIYHAQWDAKAGPGMYTFSIHQKQDGASKASSSEITLVFRVKDCLASVKVLEGRGLPTPQKPCEASKYGRFAQYKDPDGNGMLIWQE